MFEIDGPVVLSDGDVIRVGYNSIKFSERHRHAGDVSAPAPAAPSRAPVSPQPPATKPPVPAARPVTKPAVAAAAPSAKAPVAAL